MTKNKQKDNPKFGFLFGGEHFNYYQYKVTTEQASKWHIPLTATAIEKHKKRQALYNKQRNDFEKQYGWKNLISSLRTYKKVLSIE